MPHLTELTPYQAGKPLEELERELGLTDAIKLASNENPLGPSPLALAAIRDSLGSLHRYPDSHAYYLKEDLARHHGILPSQLILGNGSDEVLDLLVRALVPPGGEVLSTTHTFLMYGLLTQAVGGFFRPVPLRDMRVDLKAMAQAVTPQTRLIILSTTPTIPPAPRLGARSGKTSWPRSPPPPPWSWMRPILTLPMIPRCLPAWNICRKTAPWWGCAPFPRPMGWRACASATASAPAN